MNDPSTRRALGFRTASAELGLEKAIAIDKGDFRERNGVLQARALLRDHPDLSAVITGGPPQAIGAYRAAWELGLEIPQQLDRQLRRSTRSRLPSALADGDPHAAVAVGAAGVDALLGQLSGEPPHDVVIPTRPRIRARGSTSPHRS